jgi:FecR protein
MARNTRLLSLASIAFAVILTSLPAFADSHVRIVRLSSVEGRVSIDRGIGGGPERAILNTPIVEGTRLLTGSDGLAEVEFENESALRLTGDSEVKFAQLLMNDAGAKVNQFELTKGIVYLDTASKGDDIYRIKVGATTLLAGRDTLARLSATPEQLKIAVFHGEVRLEGGAQPVSIHKKQTLTVDLKDATKYEVAEGTEQVRFDRWNREREDYSRTYAENTGYGGPSRGYGLQDLNYYGDFFYANGYGWAWQPYGFAGSMLGWDPYSNGAWSFYPGMGYAWASAYPWGWLPYHYGSWAFINGAGWSWLPGGGYNGTWYAGNFLPVPKVTKAPTGWAAAPPPAILQGSTVPRTVLVGNTTSTGVMVPGGRIPPNFASLVPGRSAVTTASFVKPSAATRSNFAAAPVNAHPAHVFAGRPVQVASEGEIFGGAPGRVAGGPSVGIATNAAAHGSAASGHK